METSEPVKVGQEFSLALQTPIQTFYIFYIRFNKSLIRINCAVALSTDGLVSM